MTLSISTQDSYKNAVQTLEQLSAAWPKEHLIDEQFQFIKLPGKFQVLFSVFTRCCYKPYTRDMEEAKATFKDTATRISYFIETVIATDQTAKTNQQTCVRVIENMRDYIALWPQYKDMLNDLTYEAIEKKALATQQLIATNTDEIKQEEPPLDPKRVSEAELRQKLENSDELSIYAIYSKVQPKKEETVESAPVVVKEEEKVESPKKSKPRKEVSAKAYHTRSKTSNLTFKKFS